MMVITMNEFHDLILMCATAGAIFGAIRFDMKFVKLQYTQLQKAFDEHMRKFHEDRDGK